MDIAVNLVENYLRLNGYLTLSETEVQQKDAKGRYRTVTDVDVMGIRMPGAVFVGDPHKAKDCALLQLEDEALMLNDDQIDVIIGEVKQGTAELNPGIKDHAVLHSMLRRVEWLYGEEITPVIEGLQRNLVHTSPGPKGGTIRTRIVAFGRSDVTDENVIPLTQVINTMLRFFNDHEEAYRGIQFKEPAPAFLQLLLKNDFAVIEEDDVLL